VGPPSNQALGIIRSASIVKPDLSGDRSVTVLLTEISFTF